ncbi:hypothetical protein AAE478_001258 [Parahypoxylon ruwenzoriense]
MAPPVFTVDSQESAQKKTQVHLLPCRIHHDGNVDPIDTYWNPSESQDQIKTAYLRGRKLHGKAVKLPSGYYGSVAEKSKPKKSVQSRREEMAEDVELEDLEEPLETGAMQGKATFDEFLIWGHESTANASEDPYVRSMEEWISFAEQIHSYPSAEISDNKV